MTLQSRKLADLTAGLATEPVPGDIVVRDITLDSRAASPGSLFLACRGRTSHGLAFAQQAVARGASAVLYEDDVAGQAKTLLGSDIFVAAVPKLSQHVGTIADRFFGAPSAAVTVVGITGTNGKTTCAWLLAQALQYCDRPAAYMGTLRSRIVSSARRRRPLPSLGSRGLTARPLAPGCLHRLCSIATALLRTWGP